MKADCYTKWMLKIFSMIFIFLAMLGWSDTFAQVRSTRSVAAPPAANLDQIRNGRVEAPVNPGAWVNGNIGGSTAHFVEGHSIPYRVVMTSMPIGQTVVLEIEYDIKHSGKHAIDFITNYNNIEPHQSVFGHAAEDIYPTLGYTSLWPAGSSPTDEADIPSPTSVASPVAGEPTNTFNASYLGTQLGKMSI